MKIPADKLKKVLKHLTSIQGDLLTFDNARVYSTAQNIVAYARLGLGLGTLAVSAQKLSQVVARLEGDIDISLDGKLILKSKKSKLSLPTVENPNIPATQIPDKTFELPTKEFVEMVSYAALAAEKGQAFSYTGSIQLSASGQAMLSAGTDGRHLAFCEIPSAENFPALLLPVSIVPILKGIDEPRIQISEDANSLYFGFGDVMVIMRKLAKAFPDFSKLVPKTYQFRAKFKRDELRESMRRLAPLAEDKDKIHLTFENGNVIILLRGTSGDGEDSISYEQLEPDPLIDDETKFTVLVKHEFMQDFAETVSGDVILNANSAIDPVILESGNRRLLMAAQR